MRTVFIYALNDPITGKARYIGKAVDPYARYEEHLWQCHAERSYKANWIRSVLNIGKTPQLEVLDEVPEAEWSFWECEWIKLYRMLGFRLTNATDGGDCGPSQRGKKRSKEAIERIRASQTGKIMSPEFCADMSKRLKGNKHNQGNTASLETRAKMSRAHMGNQYSVGRSPWNKGKKQSPELLAKLSLIRKGAHRSPEHIAALNAGRARYWEAKRLGVFTQPQPVVG